jgi:hypothetical protein
MQTQINTHQLYNLLFSGTITLKEYLREMKAMTNSDNN